MEKMQEQEQAQDVFENDIQMYLTMFCEEQGIEDLKKESQSVWNAALMYIKRHVFSDSSILKLSTPLEGYVNNNYTADNNIYKLNSSNCNAYDIDKLNGICDYYIYICMMYDKEVSIIGFSNLTGVSDTVIYEWGADESRKLSTAGSVIYKKLRDYREESLSNKLVTGKQNPVGVLGVLNRHYAWNMPGVRQEQNKQHVLAMDELPQLGGNSTMQIAQNK